MSKKETNPHKRMFEQHGVFFRGSSGGNDFGDCPFCGKEGKFYANLTTGQWDCKVCGRNGNRWTFLSQIYETRLSETGRADRSRLAKLRNLPVEAFELGGFAWDGVHWLLPCMSPEGKIADIRRWTPPKNGGKSRCMSTAGCKTHLIGVLGLLESSPTDRVWLCEGEWDWAALQWVFSAAGLRHEIVVATPGANIFKEEWLPLLRDRDVVIALDNDDAGRNGLQRDIGFLESVARSCYKIGWEESDPEGMDLRDLICAELEAGSTPEEIAEFMLELPLEIETMAEAHRPRPVDDPNFRPHPVGGDAAPPTWSELLSVYRKHMVLRPDMVTALQIMLATAFFCDQPGDPLWMYMIGPAGCGKTMLLMTLAGSERCVYQSSIRPKSLVSGFRADPDPSILPTWNRRCPILKDFTEVLASHPNDKDAVYGTLRGAYDGYVHQNFANGVEREYWLSFSLLAGVTPAIHGDRQAMMGERFLKYEMFKGNDWSANDEIRSAIRGIGNEKQVNAELMDVCGRFLSREFTNYPEIPQWVEDQMVALCQLSAALRANVERERGASERLCYRPQREVGTRLAKQLCKLGQGLAFVEGSQEITPEIYRILKKVASDTATGFHIDVIAAMMDQGGIGTRHDLEVAAAVPATTLGRALEDLQALGIVFKNKAEALKGGQYGRPSALWHVSDWVQELWEGAALERSDVF